jgi:hypothetical protein
MHPLGSLAKSVLEKPSAKFRGIIRELGVKKPLEMGKKLLLSWETKCHFLARNYTICLRQ